MAATTPSEVREVLDVDSSEYPDAEIQPDIDDAAAVVSGSTRPADLLAPRARIESLVAAHFVQETDDEDTDEYGRVSSVSRGGKSVSFQIPDTPEEQSPYWRRAMMLCNGELGEPTEDDSDSWDFQSIG
jgi:hypothetical protein